jgi:hypothetical protein
MADEPLAPGGTPAASALMPDTPLPAEQMPLGTPDQPAIGRLRSDAMAQINAYKADPIFQERLLRGDMAALADVQRLQKIINSPTQVVVGGVNPQEVQQRLDTWSNYADLNPGVLEQIRSQGPVSAAEYKLVQQTRTRLMADREWAKRYLDGGVKERQQLSLISIILSSPIAEAK